MNNVRYLKDHNGRPLPLYKEHFVKIIEDAEKRSVLDEVEGLFANPDEVWWEKVSDEPEIFYWKYFKFFSDGALVGIATTDGDPMELYIIDWYILRPQELETDEGIENVIDLARCGFLLYNKK